MSSSIDDLTVAAAAAAASAFMPDGPATGDAVDVADVSAASNYSNWKPITFTLVEYPEGNNRQRHFAQPVFTPLIPNTLYTIPPGDLFGQLLACISLTPLCIAGSFIPLILFRRDLHTITFFAGTLLNELLNKLLKHWIREPRPLRRSHVHEEYGMPSSHAQFIWFFSTYVTLFVLLRLHHNHHNTTSSHSNSVPLERTCRALIVLACWLLAGLVCLSRTYLQYHTQPQVLAGGALGVCSGTAWFAVTHLLLTPIFPLVVQWRFSEFFMLRDTTLIPNILWFEYRITRQEARARSRKLTRMKSQ